MNEAVYAQELHEPTRPSGLRALLSACRWGLRPHVEATMQHWMATATTISRRDLDGLGWCGRCGHQL